MIIDWLEEWFKGVLIDGIIGNLSGLFDTVNTKVGEIAADVGATPQGWNSGIFNMIRNLSESVIIPIAGAILAFVMTYELIQMVTEKNNLHDIQLFLIFRGNGKRNIVLRTIAQVINKVAHSICTAVLQQFFPLVRKIEIFQHNVHRVVTHRNAYGYFLSRMRAETVQNR